MSEETFELTVIPGDRLRESPILLLLHFHNALREELGDLRRTAAEALDSRTYGPDLIQELRRRFEFLKLVNRYHSVAEDEVIFRALDVHVKNVVSAYTLEHTSTNDILESIFHYLDVLKREDEKNMSKPFQELVYFIGTLQTSICKHMAKEEEQVFPLLTRQFSTKEQASFVWQFMCSVPMLLLEDFFRWMNSFLSSDERQNVLQCVKQVVPKDLLIQEVVISCLETTEQATPGDFDKYGKGSLFLNGRANLRKILEVYKSEGHRGEPMKPENEHPLSNPTAQYNPLGGAQLWHNSYHKDLLEVLDELYSIRDSNDFSGLAPAIVQLKFFADVIIFYSNALDKIFYSMCVELAEDCPAPSYQRFLDDSQIEGLQLLLYSKSENVMSARNFVENLCNKLTTCATGIRKYLTFVEIEVFPLIVMNCSHEMQRWLLYASLEMMPFGLLKCTVTWFSSHLSEDESKSILHSIKQGGLVVNKSLSSLLYEWVRIGYSGKTSVEKFRLELHAAFENRCSFLSEQIKKGVSTSSSAFNSSSMYDTSYSSGINFHVLFPQKLNMSTHLSTYATENNTESRPVDHIIFFHKALKKDMEQVVSISANLAVNGDLFEHFYRRFHHIRVLHKIHSDAEDEFAFPALEAKEIIQNSSHSYSIDHKMDAEYFNRISYVLDQISELYYSGSSQGMLMYRQLCAKLHSMCKGMNKMLSDHMAHEEIDLWPLFTEHLSLKEQEKIIGSMLGRTRAETLQEMIPWIMASLTVEEQNSLMSLWRKATKNTMFDQWLSEWWEGMKWYDVEEAEKSTVSTQSTLNTLEIVLKYLPRERSGHENRETSHHILHCETTNDDEKEKKSNNDKVNEPEDSCKVCSVFEKSNMDSVLALSQEELEAIILRVNGDDDLEPQQKSM
ncbi:zinc finger protein BRUTUS-like protein isoform X1, partial [Tanacetum coccineum]